METVVEAPVETVITPVAAIEPQIEQTQTEQPIGTTEPAPQEPADVQPQTQKWKLKYHDQEVEVDENEARNLAQQGFDYTKKMQAFSDMERANQQKLQLADGLLNSPEATKFVIAKQLGYDPNMVLGNVQAPDPSWREQYPEQFGRQQAQFELAQQQKTAFETAVNGILALNTQSANAAVFQKAKLENNLDDGQYQRVQDFVQQRMRPNLAGMYSSEDVNYAVVALGWKDKLASEKLTQANKIQQTIKSAANTRGQVSQKPETISPLSKEARDYKEYVERASRGWTAKG